ncbi:hypothetical protein ShzoTeo12_53720 (plasmid) [Shinella zoogloeoides]|nr:hypothetical protein ShzoTeo12_53720 [Shinella zoogloeoides]
MQATFPPRPNTRILEYVSAVSAGKCLPTYRCPDGNAPRKHRRWRRHGGWRNRPEARGPQGIGAHRNSARSENCRAQAWVADAHAASAFAELDDERPRLQFRASSRTAKRSDINLRPMNRDQAAKLSDQYVLASAPSAGRGEAVYIHWPYSTATSTSKGRFTDTGVVAIINRRFSRAAGPEIPVRLRKRMPAGAGTLVCRSIPDLIIAGEFLRLVDRHGPLRHRPSNRRSKSVISPKPCAARPYWRALFVIEWYSNRPCAWRCQAEMAKPLQLKRAVFFPRARRSDRYRDDRRSVASG